jgi:nucleoid DNA-binding protein
VFGQCSLNSLNFVQKSQGKVDIKAFVRELLFSHDCVIIPGFGGFIGNYSPAHIDPRSGLFHPPVKRISFNVKLNHNDGLLISKISQAKGINYVDSKRLVGEFASELNRKIARGEEVVFDHIGRVLANSEYRLQFEPETDINYLVDSYGLESFQCFPVNDYDIRRRVVRHIDRDPIRQNHFQRNLWRAAVIIPILALLVFVPLRRGLFKTGIETSSLNPLVTAEFENNKNAVDEAVSKTSVPRDKIVTADSASVTSDSAKAISNESETGKDILSQPVSDKVVVADSKITEARELAPAKGKPVISSPASEVRYAIITGSFRSEENAESHVRVLRADGFAPEIVKTSNGYYRVYAMKCPTIENALFRKDSLAKKFPSTWITKY